MQIPHLENAEEKKFGDLLYNVRTCFVLKFNEVVLRTRHTSYCFTCTGFRLLKLNHLLIVNYNILLNYHYYDMDTLGN